jgi:hypothetical protein
MQGQMYSENDWRHFVIMQLIGIRRSIYELCLAIGLLVLGFLSTKWEPDAPLIAAAAVCGGALTGCLRERKSQNTLERHYDKMSESD